MKIMTEFDFGNFKDIKSRPEYRKTKTNLNSLSGIQANFKIYEH